jgi:hypothetical protein
MRAAGGAGVRERPSTPPPAIEPPASRPPAPPAAPAAKPRLADLINEGGGFVPPIPGVGFGAFKVPPYRPREGDKVVPFTRRAAASRPTT